MRKAEVQRTINNLKKLENALITEACLYESSQEPTEIVERVRNQIVIFIEDLRRIKQKTEE